MNVVLELVQTFGALTTVTVTTLRKAVSMIVSFVFFPKPFSMGYIWGGVIILGGTTRSTSVNRGVPQTYPLFFYIMFSFFLSLMRSAKHSFLSPVFSFCSFGCFPRGFLSLYFLSDSPRPMYMSFFCYGGQGNHIGVPTQSTRCCLPALITAVPCHALPSNAAANCANVLWCRCTAQGLRQIFMLNRRKRQQGVQTYCQPTPSPQRLQREHQCFFRHHPAMMIIAGAVPVAAVVAVAAAVLTVAGCGPVAHNSFRM